MTTKEDYLKNLILKRWTLKDFAATIDMPYGTLYSILRNVDGGSLHNILKICNGLHISADTLAQIGKNQSDCLLNDDTSTYGTGNLPDLRYMLNTSRIRFDGVDYRLSRENRDLLTRLIKELLRGKEYKKDKEYR